MKTTTITTTITALALSAIASTALAGDAWEPWGNKSGWVVQSNSEIGVCMASAPYLNGDLVTAGISRQGKGNIIVVADQLRYVMEPGQPAQVTLHFEPSGFSRVLVSAPPPQGRNAITVSASDPILTQFIEQQSMQVFVSGLMIGNYKLTGSYAAMSETVRCLAAQGGYES